MPNYKCDDCGGELIYHEQDLEHGEHHECPDCGKIYPYESGNVENGYDELRKGIDRYHAKTVDHLDALHGLVQRANKIILEYAPLEVQGEWMMEMLETYVNSVPKSVQDEILRKTMRFNDEL